MKNMWKCGGRDGSNCDIACNRKPCWDLIFQKESGSLLLIIGDLGALRRGTVSNREITGCISHSKLKKQGSKRSA
ncbi:hypothetical protein NC652_010788 [Populus alba x Populus x berolinensis]|nr:hypothetical protein NC652_010788 [Populus alba x Populus x berolinensis]